MPSLARRLGPAALAALLCLSAGSSVGLADDRPKTPDQRADELARQSAAAATVALQLKGVVDAANAKIEILTAQRAAAVAEVDALSAEIQLAEQMLVATEAQLDATRAQIAQLAADVAVQTLRLQVRESLYTEHLRATYRTSRTSTLEMLLSSASLSEFSRRVDAMLYLDREDARLAREIRTLREGIESDRLIAAARADELLATGRRIAEQRVKLVDQRIAFESVVRHATAAVAVQVAARSDAQAGRAQALATAARADAAARALALELEQAEGAYPDLAAKLAAESGLGLFTGLKLGRRPLDGLVSSSFGPRLGGFHNGMDLAAPMYTPVIAAGDGIVVTVGHPYLASGDTAEVVIIAHGSNLSTLYGHLDDLVRLPPVTLGQRVKAGDVIGYVGMSGHTTGPHVHFMTILGGKAVDPALFIPTR